jgi:hypothetical protein
MDTGSYHQFAEGYFLAAAGMAWFWDQYLPDESRRSEILASPLRGGSEELAGLPLALVINVEADVLRDEGNHTPRTTRRDPRRQSRHSPGRRVPARRAPRLLRGAQALRASKAPRASSRPMAASNSAGPDRGLGHDASRGWPLGAVLPSGARAGCCGRSQVELSLKPPLTRASRESYAVETMALCLALRLLLLPRKGE